MFVDGFNKNCLYEKKREVLKFLVNLKQIHCKNKTKMQ